MKTSASLLVLLTSVAAANPADYLNFVRQIQVDSLVEWDVTVAAQGSMISPEGVGPAGSLYQLWSVHKLTATEFHLDEQFVSAYTPEAAITIRTADPYGPIPRTRVDQPFSVRIDVDGLLDGLTDADGVLIPSSAKQVLLTHDGGLYVPGTHVFDPTLENPYSELATATIKSNGNFDLDYAMTNIKGKGTSPMKMEGEEVWTISTLELSDDGKTLVKGDQLERAVLQIWPLASATLSGWDSTQVYEDIPPLTVGLKNLYPDSSTWLRVYAGAPQANPSDPTEIQSSYVVIKDSIPRSRALNLADLNSYFPRNGDYTVEVIHQTPFGTEMLAQIYPIKVERKIEVRGTVFSR